MSTLRALWGPRPQTREAGVIALLNTLEAARSLRPAIYGGWCRLGGSRKSALDHRIPLDAESLDASLTRNHTDERPRRVIEELGYTFSAWNGADDSHAVNVRCTFGVTSPRVRNVVNLGLLGSSHEEIGRELMELVNRFWTPDEIDIWRPGEGTILRLGT